MNNYEYIIASLPEFGKDSGILDAGVLTGFILSQCSPSDASLVQLVIDGCSDRERLDKAFYERALGSRNTFIREYFRFDLMVRNTKVEYLNHALGRPEATDIMPMPGTEDNGFEDSYDFEEKPSVMAVLEQTDILERERGMDRLMWGKAEELTSLHLFDLDMILAFVTKLMISDRWNRLDPETGRRMFRTLVQEIRNTR
ncbi:MAG: DUF2764 family protein [Bacteroidales bacterium]|nr:DUF2764 family protein [Bacteroidales bacterium]